MNLNIDNTLNVFYRRCRYERQYRKTIARKMYGKRPRYFKKVSKQIWGKLRIPVAKDSEQLEFTKICYT